MPARTDRHSDRLQDFSDFRRSKPRESKVTQQSGGPRWAILCDFRLATRLIPKLGDGSTWGNWIGRAELHWNLPRRWVAEYCYSMLFNSTCLYLFIRVVWPNNVPLRCFFHLSYGVLCLLLSPVFAFLSFSLLLLLLLLLTLPICWFQFLIHLFPIFPSQYLHVWVGNGIVSAQLLPRQRGMTQGP